MCRCPEDRCISSLVEVQKLLYFMQAAGQPLRLNFVKGRYGPYADNLRHVLATVEGHYLIGYGDGSSPVLDAEPIKVLPGADEMAIAQLSGSPDNANGNVRQTELGDLASATFCRSGDLDCACPALCPAICGLRRAQGTARRDRHHLAGWKPALNAFAITFEGRLNPTGPQPTP